MSLDMENSHNTLISINYERLFNSVENNVNNRHQPPCRDDKQPQSNRDNVHRVSTLYRQRHS